MAQLVVWIAEKELSGDPTLDNARWAPGYVVDVLEDDQPLSKVTLEEVRWKIVSLPGVPVEKVRAMAAPASGFVSTPDKQRDPLAFRRETKIDLVALAALEAHPVKGEELKKNPAKAEAHIKALAVAAHLDRAIADALAGKGR